MLITLSGVVDFQNVHANTQWRETGAGTCGMTVQEMASIFIGHEFRRKIDLMEDLVDLDIQHHLATGKVADLKSQTSLCTSDPDQMMVILAPVVMGRA
jgi:hypothetical protein